MQLKNRTAIVTGSTSGIGLGIATALAQAGANVVVNGLGSEADNAAAIRQVSKSGTRVTFDGADMLRHNQIAAMIERTERDFGSVDILVNNAGIQYVAPVEEFPIEKWDAIIAINLSSSFHTVRTALPAMKARRWGRIVNIASAHALVASPYKSAYVAAKHGIAGFTKSVALEVAEHPSRRGGVEVVVEVLVDHLERRRAGRRRARAPSPMRVSGRHLRSPGPDHRAAPRAASCGRGGRTPSRC